MTTMIVKTAMETKVKPLASHFANLYLGAIPTGFKPVTTQRGEGTVLAAPLLEKIMQISGLIMTHQRMPFTGKIVRIQTLITGLLMKTPVFGIGQVKEKING